MTTRNLRAVATALFLGTAAFAGAAILSAPAAAAVRASVGTPIQAAVTLAKQGNWAAAKAKIAEAEAVGGKSAEESAIINQMKNYVAVSSGDTSTAAGAKAKFANDYNARKYKDVIADADALRKFGALDGASMQIVAQSYYLSGDKAGCQRYIKNNFGANAGDATLELLMRCAYDNGDDAVQQQTLETLVARSGKKEHWANLLKLSERAKGMRDHDTLDIYRLKLLTGTITGKDEYLMLATLALQLGFAPEAEAVLTKGMVAVKELNDDRTKRLLGEAKKRIAADAANAGKTLAAANAAPQGDALVKVGENQTVQGKPKDAIVTIQNAMKKPLADKSAASIRLGQAYLAAGQKADAVKAFDSVKGPAGDKAAMIAHLWSLYARKG